MTHAVTLTSDQIEFFHREGYLALDALMEPGEVEQLRIVYDELFASQAGREEGNQNDLVGADDDDRPATLPQIVNPSKYAPQLEQMAIRGQACGVAQQLLGADAKMQGEHAIMKPPKTEATTPWHQDEAYWAGDLEYNTLGIWIPLQDVTPESGSLRYIPGSHKSGVMTHQPIGNDPRVHGLETNEVDESKAVTFSIPAGGALIHHCRMIHGAGGNLTSAPRRAYIFAFATPPTKRKEPRDFYWKEMRQTARDQRRRASGTASDSDGRRLAEG